MKRLRRLLVIGWLCLPLIVLARPQVPPAVTLEPAQQQWLESHRSLRVGLVLQAPYAQFDRRLQQLYGANVELVNGLGQALGLDLTWRNFTDQASLEHALQAGEIDFAPGLTQTPASLRLWLFSDPYMRVPQLLVGPRTGAMAVELEKLDAQTRVAVRMPSALADYLRGNYSGLNVQGVPSEREALQWVVGGQASYAVLDEAQLSRLSRENEFAELVVVGDIGLPQLLRVGSRRDWPMLAEVLERGLQAMPAKELEQLHQRWLQPKYPRLSESPGFWQNLALLFGMLLLCTVATLVWQRRQQRQLERSLLATRESLTERQGREEALRLSQFAIDQSTVGILWVNWDSHVRYANHAVEAMLGYAEAELLERPLSDFEPNLTMDRWLELWKGPAPAMAVPGNSKPNAGAPMAACSRWNCRSVSCVFAMPNTWWCTSPMSPSAIAPWPRCAKARRGSRVSPAMCRAWCSALNRRRPKVSRNFPTSAKAARRWWGTRLRRSSTR